MRRKQWYLVLWLLTLTAVSYAQTTTSQEVTVFLKNGKVMRGQTTLSMFEGHLTLDQGPFDQVHVPYEDIRQIVFGVVSPKQAKQMRVRKPRKVIPFEVQERGFFRVVHLGFFPEGGNYVGETAVTASATYGYTFRPYFKLGLGIGLDHYGYGNITALPIFASVQGFLNKKRGAPFYFVNAGGSFAWVSTDQFVEHYDTDGGLMIHPGIGYRYSTGKVGISFSVGYKVQYAALRYRWQDWGGAMIDVDEARLLRHPNLSLGVHF